MPGDIETALKNSGLETKKVYGGFDFKPFDALESTDLIVVAQKNSTR